MTAFGTAALRLLLAGSRLSLLHPNRVAAPVAALPILSGGTRPQAVLRLSSKPPLMLGLRFAPRLAHCLFAQSNRIVTTFRFFESQKIVRLQHVQ